VTDGIVYVAYGDKARSECEASIETLQRIHRYPVTVISDQPFPGAAFKYAPQIDLGGRWAKLNLDEWSPYENTLYIDADTRIRADLSHLFNVLRAGFELCIAPSTQQGRDHLLWHVGEGERKTTFNELGYLPVQLQGGVFSFRKTKQVMELFATWREEWERWNGQDQGALLRAIHRVPVRYWLLGRPFNGTTVIQHNFGGCR